MTYKFHPLDVASEKYIEETVGKDIMFLIAVDIDGEATAFSPSMVQVDDITDHADDEHTSKVVDVDSISWMVMEGSARRANCKIRGGKYRCKR
jgi:hypothetical protein